MKFPKITLIILIFSALFLGCQKEGYRDYSLLEVGRANVTGVITLASQQTETKEIPVANARVWIESMPNLSVYSNENGSFVIQNVSYGSFNLVAQTNFADKIFKGRSLTFTTSKEKDTQVNLKISEATNIACGRLLKETGEQLEAGVQLSLWGDYFEVKHGGYFETPPLPSLQEHEIMQKIVVYPNFSESQEFYLPFISKENPQKVEFLIHSNKNYNNEMPRIALIPLMNNEVTTSASTSDTLTIRAIITPESNHPNCIEWVCNFGSITPTLGSQANTREVKWTPSNEGGKAIIEATYTNSFYSAKSELTIDIATNKAYRIFYNDNFASSGAPPFDNNYYSLGSEVIIKDKATLEREGYQFAYWTDSDNIIGTNYQPGTIINMPPYDLFLFSRWQENPSYKLIYDGNQNTSGLPPIDSRAYKSGETATIIGNTEILTKDGFRFVSWNTLKDGSGNNYFGGDLLYFDGQDITLYAKWEKAFKVLYFGNNNTSGDVPIDLNNYQHSETAKVKKNTNNLKKEGYEFDGWNTQADGSGVFYYPDSTLVIPNLDVRLYANWKPKTTFSVAYHGNGNTSGLPPTDNNKYYAGANLFILDNYNNLERRNHTFSGWNTKPDGSGTQLFPNSNFELGSANLDLYAKWVPVFIVSYYGNTNTSGIPPIDSKQYLQNETVTVLQNTGNLAKEDYKFMGWGLTNLQTEDLYEPNHTFAMPAQNISFFAIWKPFYSVTYHGNSNDYGEPPLDLERYSENERVFIKEISEDFKKNDYFFVCWNTKANGTGTNYSPGASLLMSPQHLDLFAIWHQKETFSLTYHPNGATLGLVPDDETFYSEGAVIYVLGNEGNLTKEKNRFDGWNTQADGSGQSYKEGSQLIIPNYNIVLYAQWYKENELRIIYHPNEADSGNAPVDNNYYSRGDLVIFKGNSGNLVKEGYSFNGWNTNSQGTGTSFQAGTAFYIGDSTVHFYALWKQELELRTEN